MGRKPGKSPSHLIRIGTVYHYRRVIPPRLSDTIKLREIKVTLRTSVLEEAREKANRVESLCPETVSLMESDSWMKADISLQK